MLEPATQFSRGNDSLRRAGGCVLCAMTVLASLMAWPGMAQSFELVTGDQLEQERMAVLDSSGLLSPADRRMRASGLSGPQLELLAPSSTGPLKSPLDIALRWRTEEGVSIDPASLRVLYGVLKLDITARVLSNAKVSANGLEAKGAQLPAGVHRIFVQITDTAKRVAQRELVIEILGP